jgi:zinc transporter ZupT
LKAWSILPAPYGFVFVVITFFSTMIGEIFTLRKTGVSINILFAFAAGALIGISFFDILPESVSISLTAGVQVSVLMSVVVAAFLLFQILDQCIVCLHTGKDGQPGHALRLAES